jgi:hypothetical protein
VSFVREIECNIPDKMRLFKHLNTKVERAI